jgi:hypothetical protein
MKKSLLFLLALVLLITIATPILATPVYRGNGFIITPGEITLGSAPQILFISYLPSSTGTNLSVSVSTTQYNGTLSQYPENYRKKLARDNIKLSNQKLIDKGTALLEFDYHPVKNRTDHCYYRILQLKNRIYEAQTSAPQNQWPAASAMLKRCVDSFRFATQASGSPLYIANGVAITPLEGTGGSDGAVLLYFYLTITEKMAPDVSVRFQTFNGGLDDYLAITRSQLKEHGMKMLLHKKLDRSTAVMEYTDTVQGHAMHFYLRVVKQKNRIYLVTATTPQSQWPRVGKKLKACVDSFRLRKK